MRNRKRTEQEREFYAALRPALIEAAFAKGCSKRAPVLAWVMHDFAKFAPELKDDRAQSAARGWAERHGLPLDSVAFVHATKTVLREQVWPKSSTKNNRGINTAIDDLVKTGIVIVVHETIAARNGLSNAALYALVLPTNQNHTHECGSESTANQNHTHECGSDMQGNQNHILREPEPHFEATVTTPMDVGATQIPNTELNTQGEEVKSIGDLASEAIAQAAALSGHQLPMKPKSTTSPLPAPQPQSCPSPAHRSWREAYDEIRNRQ